MAGLPSERQYGSAKAQGPSLPFLASIVLRILLQPRLGLACPDDTCDTSTTVKIFGVSRRVGRPSSVLLLFSVPSFTVMRGNNENSVMRKISQRKPRLSTFFNGYFHSFAQKHPWYSSSLHSVRSSKKNVGNYLWNGDLRPYLFVGGREMLQYLCRKN